MHPENIKTKINFHLEGVSRPFASAEDYQTLKRLLYIKNDAKIETTIEEIIIKDEAFEIIDAKITILNDTIEGHPNYGIDSALAGESLPYNFRLSLFLRKKEN